ncbi:retrotransposon-related protein [Tanacetum coccineum]
MENLNEVRVKELRSDNGTEFKNYKLEEFFDEKGISQNFSSSYTPEQNGGEAVYTACYTQNISIIMKRHGKTAYDVFRGRSSDICYFHVFGYPVFIHNHKDHLGKFDEKADENDCLPYVPIIDPLSTNNITITDTVTPTTHNINSSDESPEFSIANDHPIYNEPDDLEPAKNHNDIFKTQNITSDDNPISKAEPSLTIISPLAEINHDTPAPQDKWSRDKYILLVNILGEPLAGVTTRSRVRDFEAASAYECLYVNFLLLEIDTKKVIESLEEEVWVIAMQEELNQHLIFNALQTQTSNALHNAIMESGGKDRPPMLAPGNYAQWKSRIKRYIDTKPNNELIYYCLQNPPYKFKLTEKTVPVAEGSSKTTTEGYMDNYKNVSQYIRDQLNAEAEVVQIILTGIYNDIYSTVDSCPNTYEMWKAIERLKQGESINVQNLETNLYWEFRKFTSWDGESLESYYSRFVTLVKHSQGLKIVSYHKLYDILKQHQNEVKEIRAERLVRTANPLALRKAIVNSPPPTYDQETTMVDEDDALSKEKEIDKLMALISLSFKKIYKPTNNNLRTSSNTNRANQDNTLRINKGNRYDNQRVVNIAGARENVARECQKLKWAKDATYHKEKMLLCKQEEVGIQLSAEQYDWWDDTDDELED